MTPQPDFQSASQYALNRLETQLPPSLCYHSIYHTREDVLPAAKRLADLEGIDRQDRLLLLTAAVFHDVGFTIQVDNHESLSAQIVRESLPQFGYTPDQIRQISEMILVTKLFTPPKTLLEAILVDADLDVLGREDFLNRNYELRLEIVRLGKEMSDEQWLHQQLMFMYTHRYRTISAQALRDSQKNQNTKLLNRMLETCFPVTSQLDHLAFPIHRSMG